MIPTPRSSADLRSFERRYGRILAAVVFMYWLVRRLPDTRPTRTPTPAGPTTSGFASASWNGLERRSIAGIGVDTPPRPRVSTTFDPRRLLGADRYGLENVANLKSIPPRRSPGRRGHPWEGSVAPAGCSRLTSLPACQSKSQPPRPPPSWPVWTGRWSPPRRPPFRPPTRACCVATARSRSSGSASAALRARRSSRSHRAFGGEPSSRRGARGDLETEIPQLLEARGGAEFDGCLRLVLPGRPAPAAH